MTVEVKEPTWHATLESEGRIDFRVGRFGDELIAEWPGRATLRAHRSNGSSELVFAPHVEPRWKRKLEHGLVRGMLAHVRGELTLHASAIADEHRAILLVGASGAGKSTLAAALCHEGGLRVVADDASPIQFASDYVLVGPGDDELWLWRDARRALGIEDDGGEKAPLKVGEIASGAMRIAAVVVLTFSSVPTPRLTRLRGHDALSPLLAATIRLVVDEHDVQLREIVELGKLVDRAPVYQLTRKKDFADLERAADAIRGLLEGEAK